LLRLNRVKAGASGSVADSQDGRIEKIIDDRQRIPVGDLRGFMETSDSLLGRKGRKVKSTIIGRRKSPILSVLLLGPILTGFAAGCGDFWQAPTAGGTTTDTVSLTASASSVVAGGSVTLTATISPSSATGTVIFYSGSTSLGSATVSSGVATLSPTFSTAGTLSITADYSGDTTYESSVSSAVSLTVTAALTNTITTLTATNPTSAGSVTFTAAVTPAAATGTVTFYNGATSLGTGTLASGTTNATATSTVTLTAGTYSVTATYAGNSTYATSTSSAVAVTVPAASPGVEFTTITVDASSASASPGDSIALTATVSNPDATGLVTFYDAAASPARLLGIAPLSSGTATIPATFSSEGTHQIMASYSGALGYAASITQSPLPIMIDK
jgi:hypothetical protein